MSRNDENKVMTGLDKPVPSRGFNPRREIVFSADFVRSFPTRPIYEREIEKAMWMGFTSATLRYLNNQKLAIVVHTRLQALGFSASRIRTKTRPSEDGKTDTEFYFEVSW